MLSILCVLVYFRLTTVLRVKFFLSIARNPEAIKEKSDKFNQAQIRFCGGEKTQHKQSKKGIKLSHIFVTHRIKDYFSVVLKSPLSQ